MIYAILASLLAFIPSLALIVWIYLQLLRVKAEGQAVTEAWQRNKAEIHETLDRFNRLQTENSELKAQILSVSHACDSLHDSLTNYQNKMASRIRQERKEAREALSPEPDNLLPLAPSRETPSPAGGSAGARRLVRSSSG